jgi:hypothetical protein
MPFVYECMLHITVTGVQALSSFMFSPAYIVITHETELIGIIIVNKCVTV